MLFKIYENDESKNRVYGVFRDVSHLPAAGENKDLIALVINNSSAGGSYYVDLATLTWKQAQSGGVLPDYLPLSGGGPITGNVSIDDNIAIVSATNPNNSIVLVDNVEIGAGGLLIKSDIEVDIISGSSTFSMGPFGFNLIGVMMQIAADDLKIIPSDTLRFFDASTGSAKITVSGSRGGNAALTSLLSGLESYGLIDDNTTA